jgi:hypothetical protein
VDFDRIHQLLEPFATKIGPGLEGARDNIGKQDLLNSFPGFEDGLGRGYAWLD